MIVLEREKTREQVTRCAYYPEGHGAVLRRSALSGRDYLILTVQHAKWQEGLIDVNK
jgi:hypothetical protein